jgi:deoxyhypusine synthase
LGDRQYAVQLAERAQQLTAPEAVEGEELQRGCKIFLGFTSNLISSGTREIIKFLCKHKMVDVMVTTAGECDSDNCWGVASTMQHANQQIRFQPRKWHVGGVEEDLIKCMAPTYVGSFYLQGKALRMKGQNRIGNMIVPNNNYCAFEEFMMPLLDEMLREQQECSVNWTPSRIIARLGERINNEDSVYYWSAPLPLSCQYTSMSCWHCISTDVGL